MATATDLYAFAAAERDMAPHVDTLIGYAKDSKIIIELGVRAGVSSWAFLTGMPKGGRLWSVDTETPSAPKQVNEDPRWVFVQGNDLDARVQESLPQKADLVFIDTIHTYEQVSAELQFAKSRNPDRIAVHDYEWAGTQKAVDEFVKNEAWEIEDFYPASDKRGPFGLVVLIPSTQTRTVKTSSRKAVEDEPATE